MSTSRPLSLLALPVLALALLAAVPDDDAAILRAQAPTYPLTTCVVSGEPLGSMGEPVDGVVDGRMFRVCCGGCTKKAAANAEATIAKIDRAVIAAQSASYPLDTCLMQPGEPLGDEPVDVVVGTRLAKVCCKMCAKKLVADPAAAMKRLDEAYIAAQLADYPLETCPLKGRDLGADPKRVLHGNTLVLLCCGKCEAAFARDPSVALAALAEARGAGAAAGNEARDG